jgi:FHS family glucose/mannose:H+ symporter-like MFS transporter
MRPNKTSFRFDSIGVAPFYAGLIASGMATVLLGPILPVLSARWSLTDPQAGALFTAQFLASMVGAVLSSQFRRESLVIGNASIALGMVLLAFGTYHGGIVAFVLIGLGIGGTVSATNLTLGTEYPEARGQLLTRVNFYWGVGAVACPELLALAAHRHALRIFLLSLALWLALMVAAFLPLLRKRHTRTETPTDRSPLRPGLFALFSLTLFLYVGAETAVAGWIATYMHRFNHLSEVRSSFATLLFWLAVVAGRAVVPAMLRFVREALVLLGGLAAAMAGVSALLFPHSAGAAYAAVTVAGLGFAPVFALLVSRLLAWTGRSRHTGWIFAICGAGGAVVPWLTGMVSQHSGSLRVAFSVPLAALAGILACTLIEMRILAPVEISGRNLLASRQ